jgi:hypothetical protein
VSSPARSPHGLVGEVVGGADRPVAVTLTGADGGQPHHPTHPCSPGRVQQGQVVAGRRRCRSGQQEHGVGPGDRSRQRGGVVEVAPHDIDARRRRDARRVPGHGPDGDGPSGEERDESAADRAGGTGDEDHPVTLTPVRPEGLGRSGTP